jgi:hypothetical protein
VIQITNKDALYSKIVPLLESRIHSLRKLSSLTYGSKHTGDYQGVKTFLCSKRIFNGNVLLSSDFLERKSR